MAERSISASERQRQLADKSDRDRIEGSIINEIRKVPTMVAGGIASHVAEADPHPQYTTSAELTAAVDAAIALVIVDSIADGDATHAPSRNAVFDALALKAPLNSPALTGTPTAPTAAPGTNTTQVASTAFVEARVAQVINAAPAALDTLQELATALGNDASFASTVTTSLAGKQPLDATLTALAGANWAANALPIGSGADTVSQVSFAANTFPARSSAGNLVAKTITDFGLSLVDDANAAAGRVTLGVVAAADSTWTAATLLNSWVNEGSGSYFDAGYRKIDTTVRLRGAIKNGTATNGTVLFTLPAGFRPSKIQNFHVINPTGAAYVQIWSTGDVIVQGGASNLYLYLDQISFTTD